MFNLSHSHGLKERFLLLLSYDRLIFFTIMEVKVTYLQLHFFRLKNNDCQKISIRVTHIQCVYMEKWAHEKTVVMSNINNETAHCTKKTQIQKAEQLQLHLINQFYRFALVDYINCFFNHSLIVSIKMCLFVCMYLSLYWHPTASLINYLSDMINCKEFWKFSNSSLHEKPYPSTYKH